VTFFLTQDFPFDKSIKTDSEYKKQTKSKFMETIQAQSFFERDPK